MNITANITGISYSIRLEKKLKIIDFENFDINLMPGSAILNFNNSNYGISKWVSPKRTRSFPYQRVYDTLKFPMRITVIPVIKDEGIFGERDYLQWDTISLMSLLDVYVIPAYYHDATPKGSKISNQKFNNDYIKLKINEIYNYQSSALHWNVQEINNSFPKTLQNAIDSYKKIQNRTNIRLHDFSDVQRFQNNISRQLNDFKEFSRVKSKQAQDREEKTFQPKELLLAHSKSKITISNYLGGLYYFTVDEILIDSKNLSIIESKYSKSSKLPKISDIKDGLLKMILYSNLKEVRIDENIFECQPKLLLISNKISGKIKSNYLFEEIQSFFKINKFSKNQIVQITNLIEEAKVNNFIVEIIGTLC